MKNAADAVATDPQAGGGVGISITVGGSKSQSKTTQTSDTAATSNLTAGRDIRIEASGAGKDSDILLQGAQVTAARNILLSAEDEIRLLAARNDSSLDRNSKGSSAAIGLAITYGSSGFAAGITASASTSKGNADGKDVSYTNTRVEAGNLLTLESGGDTTLRGAVAGGKQVIADIGGNLNIESLQDTSTYHRKDQSMGGSVTVGYGFAASANVGQQKIDSDFASVTAQSGIQAGDGGFDIRVKNNTDLKGAVIASTEQAAADGKNRLETGTLTMSDIKNKAEYEASSFNLGGGYTSEDFSLVKPDGSRVTPASSGVGTDQQGKTATGGQTPGSALPDQGGFSAAPPLPMNAEDKAESTTKSGISLASIILTDEERQKSLTGKDVVTTLASLNRDVATGKDTTNALKPIFDEEKIDAQFAIAGAFSREMGTFLVNRAKEADAAKAALDSERAKPADQQDQSKLTQLQAAADEAALWGPGGSYRQIATALTAAASGNVAASGSEFIRAAATNYLQSLGAEQIKRIADSLMVGGKPTAESEATRTALQGLLACAGAVSQGQGCGAGAAGAAASVILNNMLEGLSGKDADTLSAQEKEARRNLVGSLIAGIAAIAGGGNVATATNAALIETDNNALVKKVDIGIAVAAIKACQGKSDCVEATLKDFDQKNRSQLADCKIQGNCDRLVQQYKDGIDALIANRGALGETQFKASLQDNLQGMAEAVNNGKTFEANIANGKQFTQLLVDLAPLVGTASSFYELLTGQTAVTQEEANRGLAAFGIVLGIAPGGKAALQTIEGVFDAGKVASQTARTLAENQIKGAAFERTVLEFVQSSKNTTAYSAMVNGRTVTVIPDAATGADKILEIKDVAYLTNSPQFRTYAKLVDEGGDVASGSLKGTTTQFDAVDLIVSPNTRISQPLRNLIKEANGSIREFDPVTKTLRPWSQP